MPICHQCLKSYSILQRHRCNDEQWRREADEDAKKEGEMEFIRWSFDKIIVAVKDELERARKKFPEWPKDQIHGAAIANEEAGELLQASLQYEYEHGTLEKCDKEAIQMIAMGFRFLLGE